MRILATGDLHGHLPEIPKCDLLLVAGDVCPMRNHGILHQQNWLDGPFRRWLNYVPAQHIVGIAGNHDFIFERPRSFIDELHLPWIYLQDEAIGIGDLMIHGLPWVPNLPAWAFHLDKVGLKLRYDAISKGIDIVLSHGPPYGYGDLSVMGNVRVGCKSATDMLNRVKPKAFVCGHIHEGFGYYRHTHRDHLTEIYNVAYVDEYYRPHPLAEPIVEIDLSDDVKIDAIEEQTDAERPVYRSDTDA